MITTNNPYEAPQLHASEQTAPKSFGPNARRSLPRIFWIALVAQGLILAILLFVPFGFDHPSSAGLDFDDLMLVLAGMGIAVLVGLIAALSARRFAVAGVQIWTIPGLYYFGLIIGLLPLAILLALRIAERVDAKKRMSPALSE